MDTLYFILHKNSQTIGCHNNTSYAINKRHYTGSLGLSRWVAKWTDLFCTNSIWNCQALCSFDYSRFVNSNALRALKQVSVYGHLVTLGYLFIYFCLGYIYLCYFGADQIIAFVIIILEIMHYRRYGKDAALTYNILIRLCIVFRILPILFVIDAHSKESSNTQKQEKLKCVPHTRSYGDISSQLIFAVQQHSSRHIYALVLICRANPNWNQVTRWQPTFTNRIKCVHKQTFKCHFRYFIPSIILSCRNQTTRSQQQSS